MGDGFCAVVSAKPTKNSRRLILYLKEKTEKFRIKLKGYFPRDMWEAVKGQ